MIVDRCVTTVENVRIVLRSRLLVWMKSCYIERYSPLDLFEPASGVIRIPKLSRYILKGIIISQVRFFVATNVFT